MSTQLEKDPAVENRRVFGPRTLDIHGAILEFCGTFMFLLFSFGGVEAINYQSELAASQSGVGSGKASPVMSIIQLLHVSAAFGLSLLISVWLFYRVTGGLFNPNVTTALLLIRAISPFRWLVMCTAQMLGAIAASAVILALTPGPLSVNTMPGNGVNKAQAVFIEMFCTAALVLSVLMLAAEKHRSTPFAPVGIGLTLFACELFSILYTGGALNTARSFGPAVVTSFDSSHWVYWLGPFLGSMLAVAIYTMLKNMQYWVLNPGQDAIDPAQSPQDPLRAMTTTLTGGTFMKARGSNVAGSSVTKGSQPASQNVPPASEAVGPNAV